MVGLMQIMIYLLAVYLVYKGVEIFQIAFCGSKDGSRKMGMIIGGVMIAGAIAVGVGAVIATELMVASMQNNMPKFPGMP